MEYSQKNIDQYLTQYPKLQRWVVQCPACGARGYTPSMPEQILGRPTMADRALRKMLQPLETDEEGFCTTCARLLKR